MFNLFWNFWFRTFTFLIFTAQLAVVPSNFLKTRKAATKFGVSEDSQLNDVQWNSVTVCSHRYYDTQKFHKIKKIKTSIQYEPVYCQVLG